MNATHVHLLLNHFPVIGTLIGSGLILWGIIKKQDQLKFAGAVVLSLMAIIAIPVYLTGEPAEESVEDLAGVTESAIKLHEDAATIAIILMSITGLASLAAIFLTWQKKLSAKTAYLAAFILSVICFAAMARTGYFGGQIRHTEIAGAAINGTQNETKAEKEQGAEKEEKEKDKDKD